MKRFALLLPAAFALLLTFAPMALAASLTASASGSSTAADGAHATLDLVTVGAGHPPQVQRLRPRTGPDARSILWNRRRALVFE